MAGRFTAPGAEFRIIDRMYHSWQVYRPDEAVADRRSRVLFLAGLSLRFGGFGAYFPQFLGRVYRGRQVYNPEEPASDHGSHVSQLAGIWFRGGGFGSSTLCVIPCRRSTPGRSFRVMDRVDRSEQRYQPGEGPCAVE